MILSVLEKEVIVRKRLKVVEELHITLNEHETTTNTKVILKKEKITIKEDPTQS